MNKVSRKLIRYTTPIAKPAEKIPEKPKKATNATAAFQPPSGASSGEVNVRMRHGSFKVCSTLTTLGSVFYSAASQASS